MADTTLFVKAGLNITTDRLKGLGTEPKHLGWGTGAGTATINDTTLFAESTEPRTACVTSVEQTTSPGDTFRANGTITANAAKTITNCALFDAAAAGRMFVKSSFDGIPLNAGDAINFTLNCQYKP